MSNIAEKPTVLVVDDEADIRRLLALVLEQEYRVLTSDNGKNALQVAEATPELAAVVTDISMPVMDGIDLLRSLRERSLLLPVIVVTAFDERHRILAALRAGAYDFITKPFDRDIVTIAVKRAVDHHNYRVFLERQQQLHAALAMAMRAAHEINNPLALIKGLVEYHQMHSNLSPELRNDLSTINSTVDALAAQVRLMGQIRHVIIDNRFGFPLLDLAQALDPEAPPSPHKAPKPTSETGDA